MKLKLSFLSVPTLDNSINHAAIKASHQSEIDEYSTMALKKIARYEKKFCLNSPSKSNSHFPAEAAKVLEKLECVEEKLNRQITMLADTCENPNLSESRAKLIEVKLAVHRVKNNMYEKHTIIKEINQFAESSTATLYHRAKLKRMIVDELVGKKKKDPNVHLKRIQTFFDMYPAEKIDKASSTEIYGLLEVHKENPDFLKKLLSSNLRLKELTFKVLIREVLFDLANRLPANCFPTFQKLFDPKLLDEKNFAALVPFLKWCVHQLEKGADSSEIADGIDKLAALFIYAPDYPLLQEIALGIKEDRHAQILAAMKVAADPADFPLLRTALKDSGLKTESDTLLPDLHNILGAIPSDILPDVNHWLQKYIAYIQYHHDSVPSNWEECRLVILNHLDNRNQNIIYRDLGSLLETPQEVQKEVLSFIKHFPFSTKKAINFFSYLFSAEALGHFKQLLNDQPDVAIRLLLAKISIHSKESLLKVREYLEHSLGSEGTILWNKMIENEETFKDEYFAHFLLKMPLAHLMFCVPFLGKKDYTQGVITVGSHHNRRLLLEADPIIKNFWHEKGYQYSYVGYQDFLSQIQSNPALCKKLIVKYGGGSDRLTEQIFSSDRKEFLFKLAQLGYPLDFLEKLCFSHLKGFNPIKEQIACNYTLSCTDESEREVRMKDTLGLIGLASSFTAELYNKIENQFRFSHAAPLTETIRMLLAKGKFHTIQKLIQLSPEKQETFIRKLNGGPSAPTLVVGDDASEIFQCGRSYQDDSDRTAVLMEVAEYLLQPDGRINIHRLEALKNSAAFRSLPFSKGVMDAIMAVLNCLGKDSQFGERLAEFQTLPHAKSPLYELVKTMVGREEITPRDVSVVMLSGLMWPTRQGNCGSCFSTAIVIEGERYRAGLRQKLEDFMVMFQENGLIRTEKSQQTVIYPIMVSDLIQEPAFQKDHLLSRAREFTIASMGSGSIALTAAPHFKTILSNKLVDYDLKHDFKKFFDKEIRNSCRWVYNAAKKDPVSQALGAWQLKDSTNTNFIDTYDKIRGLYTSVCRTVIAQLQNKYPLYQAELASLLTDVGGMIDWIQSDDFFGESYAKNDPQPILVKLNPLRHHNNGSFPWILYHKGGTANDILQTYFEAGQEVKMHQYFTNLPEVMLELIADIIIELPQSIRRLCRRHPDFSIPFHCKWGTFSHSAGHISSLKPQGILKLSKTFETHERLVGELKRQFTAFSQMPIGENLIKEIIQKMNAFDKNQFARHKYPLSYPELWSAKTLEELWKILEKSVSRMGLNIDNLGLENLFLKTIYQTELAKAAPKLVIGDSNWSDWPEMAFVANPATNSWTMAFVNAETSKIEPIKLSEITFYSKYFYHHKHNLVEAKN